MLMLDKGRVATRLPAQNLQRARSFYKDKLGLEPSEERPGGLLYRCAAGEFALFGSSGIPSGSHTQMAWDVDDIDATVAELSIRGVVFEAYDPPGFEDHERNRGRGWELSEQGRERRTCCVVSR